ncbi:MAG: hypothetical protein CNE95_06220 [Puniceicoccaceae bacterium MED-G30]|jgi:tetratricopeptide (TPR) repeat protein|nr:MAG: hypothetical protein CNE95_06220 [Puniceicoccaceae bacterium MED-G30]
MNPLQSNHPLCFLLMIRMLAVLAFLSLQGLAQAENFQNGIKAYEEGKFDAAIRFFEQSGNEKETAALRHNLALSFYQNGQPAEAIWQLERALHIEPRNKEYQFKHSALRQQLGLTPGEPTLLETAATLLSPAQWAWLATAAFWSGLAIWILQLTCKKKSTLGSKAVQILCLLLLVCALPALEHYRVGARKAVLISPDSVELRAAPAEAAPQTGLARPGERLRILDNHGDYAEVETEGAASGWIPKNTFRNTWIGDA